MKIKQNKKGQAGELISDTAALIFIALLLIIFFILSSSVWKFSKQGIQEEALEQSSHNQEHLSLYAWLQKNVEVDIEGKKQEITITDLIRLSNIDPNYKEILEQEQQKAFGELYDNYNFKTMSSKDAIKKGYEIVSIINLITILPGARPIESGLFYIPSNETIAVNLEIEK